DFVVEQVANGDRGMADFVAYFYRRAAQITNREDSSIGLIATNSIAQNHSSRVGIAPLLEGGFTIHWAIKSAPWPAQANFHYSLIVLARGDVPYAVLNGAVVERVSPTLEISGRLDPPRALAENSGLSFEGSKLTGQGFILSFNEAEELISSDPASREVIQAYLIAEDLNG
ncbi:DNA methyltransferase, partial [Mycolicibacterium moriokaense]